MIRSFFNAAMLAAESQQVIWLRLAKLSRPGGKANAEARRMVSEKVAAAAEAGTRLLRGGSTDSVVTAYRRKVRANIRRLSK